jgi:hypothetical protein
MESGMKKRRWSKAQKIKFTETVARKRAAKDNENDLYCIRNGRLIRCQVVTVIKPL